MRDLGSNPNRQSGIYWAALKESLWPTIGAIVSPVQIVDVESVCINDIIRSRGNDEIRYGAVDTHGLRD